MTTIGCRWHSSWSATAAVPYFATVLLLVPSPAKCFFVPSAGSLAECPPFEFSGTRVGRSFCHDQGHLSRVTRTWYKDHDDATLASECRRTRLRGRVNMERPSGQFQRLAKPKFDRKNPNAVLGEIEVPGLKQVCMTAQTQLFPKREAVQLLKDRIQAWCEEENRIEETGVSCVLGDPSSGTRAPRRWRAYEYTALPSRNRTLDSATLGMNVGLAVNDTRLEVTVDFSNETEVRGVGERLLDMTADVSREANAVFGYEDDASSGGEQLGPWKKAGNVNAWRKWLEVDSGEPLPESSVTAFRTVQANWADPKRIAAAMNFTTYWSRERMRESVADSETPLRRVEVFHSALHPHVIKIMETFASADALLDYFHQYYAGYLEGIYDFRAAVNPTVQAYTPLHASLRPCLSATLAGGAVIPLVTIGGTEKGVAPTPDAILEGLKLGLRHVVLEAGSSGVNETVEALNGALAFGVLARSDLFVTMVVGEDMASVRGADGVADTVRETLASGRLDSGAEGNAEDEERDDSRLLLDSVDVLVLERESGRQFDSDASFLTLWDDFREAAASSPRFPAPPTPLTQADRGSGSGDRRSRCLARHLGLGGHGSIASDRLAFLLKDNRMQNSGREEPVPTETGPAIAAEILPGVDPSIFMGDLRAGDGARTVKTIELCRDRGVLPFSTRYTGGEGGGEAGKGAAAAADFEYEDVTGDEVLAKWIMELGGGIVWRPNKTDDVARTLPLARYYLYPEWMTEIVDRGGCSPEAWAPTLSRLLPPEGNPSDQEMLDEVEETVAMIMEPDHEEGEDDEGVDGQ